MDNINANQLSIVQDGILVVEDIPIVLHEITNAVRRRYPATAVYEATSMLEAMDILHGHTPKLMILDLQIHRGGPETDPDVINGLDLLDHAREQNADILILVMTQETHDTVLDEISTADAQGFFDKHELSHMDVLLDAVDALVKDGAYFSPGILRRMKERAGNRRVSWQSLAGQAIVLSQQEHKVLDLIGLHSSSESEIAKRLGITPKAVENTKRRLREKFDLENGYRLQEQLRIIWYYQHSRAR